MDDGHGAGLVEIQSYKLQLCILQPLRSGPPRRPTQMPRLYLRTTLFLVLPANRVTLSRGV